MNVKQFLFLLGISVLSFVLGFVVSSLVSSGSILHLLASTLVAVGIIGLVILFLVVCITIYDWLSST